jgi:hypothetical protein
MQPCHKAEPEDREDDNPTDRIRGLEIPFVFPHIAYPRAIMFEQTGESDCLPA